MIHIALFAAVLAQTPQQPAPAPPPVDCSDANHSAFNFWIGDWNVTPTGSDTVVANSTIGRVVGGCAIQENYQQFRGPGGAPTRYSGASFSTFDAGHGGVWRQFYVDSNGNVTAFEGAARDGGVVLIAPGRGGAIQRMTVTPLPDGSVRQFGETSTDGGTTWSPGYDFTYRMVSTAPK